MSRLLQKLRDLDAAYPAIDTVAPLHIVASVSKDDTLQMLKEGRSVVISRGILREIIAQLEDRTNPPTASG